MESTHVLEDAIDAFQLIWGAAVPGYSLELSMLLLLWELRDEEELLVEGVDVCIDLAQLQREELLLASRMCLRGGLELVQLVGEVLLD